MMAGATMASTIAGLSLVAHRKDLYAIELAPITVERDVTGAAMADDEFSQGPIGRATNQGVALEQRERVEDRRDCLIGVVCLHRAEKIHDPVEVRERVRADDDERHPLIPSTCLLDLHGSSGCCPPVPVALRRFR